MAKNQKAVEVSIEGMSKDVAMTYLIGEQHFTFKDATLYWKENGTAIRGGIFQATLDWLAESNRSQFDLAKFIIEHGTKNEARWFGQRDAIRRLSVAARGTEGYQDVPASDTQKAALKAIVEA